MFSSALLLPVFEVHPTDRHTDKHAGHTDVSCLVFLCVFVVFLLSSCAILFAIGRLSLRMGCLFVCSTENLDFDKKRPILFPPLTTRWCVFQLSVWVSETTSSCQTAHTRTKCVLFVIHVCNLFPLFLTICPFDRWNFGSFPPPSNFATCLCSVFGRIYLAQCRLFFLSRCEHIFSGQ